METSGQLEKLELIAYETSEYKTEVPDGRFTTQINPEKVSLKYEIDIPEDQASGTSSSQATFGKMKPQDLSFEFMFDSTGAVPLPDRTSPINPLGVFPRVQEFMSVVYAYNGEEHKPNNLKIAWGKLIFKCVLKTLTIDYRLFRPDGTPIRAVASAAFQGAIDEELRVAQDAPASPDITHTRVVKDGETLQQLTKEIYGKPDYYLEVARANRLGNFRKLTTGQLISFPPIAQENV